MKQFKKAYYKKISFDKDIVESKNILFNKIHDKKILVIGSNGQIGTVLTSKLGEKYGFDNVVGSDLKVPKRQTKFVFEQCSVLDKDRLEKIINQYNITDVYLLAAFLSAKVKLPAICT